VHALKLNMCSILVVLEVSTWLVKTTQRDMRDLCVGLHTLCVSFPPHMDVCPNEHTYDISVVSPILLIFYCRSNLM
jgi:hypothetical protein